MLGTTVDSLVGRYRKSGENPLEHSAYLGSLNQDVIDIALGPYRPTEEGSVDLAGGSRVSEGAAALENLLSGSENITIKTDSAYLHIVDSTGAEYIGQAVDATHEYTGELVSNGEAITMKVDASSLPYLEVRQIIDSEPSDSDLLLESVQDDARLYLGLTGIRSSTPKELGQKTPGNFSDYVTISIRTDDAISITRFDQETFLPGYGMIMPQTL